MKFYKRFPGDINIKTGHLDPAEFGCYDRLLDHYYATEAPIPTDGAYSICRAVKPEHRRACDKVLAQFFVLTDAGWAQRRADEVIAEALPRIEAARENGKKGGRPMGSRKKPTGLFSETQTEPRSKASQSQNNSTSLRSVEIAVETPAARRPTRKCPADFVVTAEMLAWAAAKHPTVDVAVETEKLRDHTFKTAISDWEGAWRNWVRKAAEFGGSRGGGPIAGAMTFRERDEALATARVHEMTGGLVSAKPPGQTGQIVEMPNAAFKLG